MPEGYDLIFNSLFDRLDKLDTVIGKLDAKVDRLLRQQVVKEYYSVAEVASAVGRDTYTVREWCRCHRINAVKRNTGRGNSCEWSISHAELERLRNHGLLPDPALRNNNGIPI